ncbi:MAG TPA: molybdopterin-binding protein [Catalimonadaceae bacterium]|nr:molybdopterin-binding protein [Catalimonadaceae bacterium]
MTQASILTIGDEILLGQIVDTNSAHLAQSLSAIGIDVVWKCTVGDSEDRINEMLTFAFSHSDLVLITGGLGPTRDDLTKKVLANWFDSPIAILPEALADLEALLKKRGRPINPLTLSQAEHPTKAEYIKNAIGTAPGIWFTEKGKTCIAMPGVPYEMKQMMKDEIIPRLKKRLHLTPILHRFVRTIGIPESNLAMKIEKWETALPPHLKLAYLPSGGQVKLRLTGRGEPEERLANELDERIKTLLPLIEENTYATDDRELEEVTGELVVKNNLTIKFQDQVTEGYFQSKLLAIPKLQIEFSPSNTSQKGLFVSILKSNKEETGFDYRIKAELIRENEPGVPVSIERSREINAFLQPEVNRNMVSLTAFDQIRRLILSLDMDFQPKRP